MILSAKPIECAARAFQSIDNIKGGDGFAIWSQSMMIHDSERKNVPLSMLGVGDGVTDNILEEDFENTTSLFIYETRDTFDTTTAGEASDGRFGDTYRL
jgi:hypothetical protein